MLYVCHSLCLNVTYIHVRPALVYTIYCFQRNDGSVTCTLIPLLLLCVVMLLVATYTPFPAPTYCFNNVLLIATCTLLPVPTYCYDNVQLAATCTPFPVPTTVVHIW
jgi:hypothetical protein